MGKRDLRKYLAGLEKEQLEDQVIMLYEKFPEVKTYYNFVFDPKEEKLINEAKAKVSNEYFPVKSRRARMRRSVAQKYIKHFLTLGVDAYLIADLMIFNLEVAQKYASAKKIRFDSFYNSMLLSFRQAADYFRQTGIQADFEPRMASIKAFADTHRWPNSDEFLEIYRGLYNSQP